MYTLMNKNEPLIDFVFEFDTRLGTEVFTEKKVYKRPWFVPGIEPWIMSRLACNNRENISKVLRFLRLGDALSMITYSGGLSLTDTLWVNTNDKYLWENINLFDHPFDEAVARMAFDGKTTERTLRSVTPELTTAGNLAKCWIRDSGGAIRLLKRGSSIRGFEPYSEQYCSELLDILEFDHIKYTVVQHCGKIASSCDLLTSKDVMMIPLVACLPDTLKASVFKFFTSKSFEKELAETIVFDYIVCNDDRHLNNIAVLADANTFEISRVAPIYDNGCSLLPDLKYAVKDSHVSRAHSNAERKRPVFYDDFYSGAIRWLTPEIRQAVSKLSDYVFRRDYEYQLTEHRLILLEQFIHDRVAKLLREARET